MQYPDTAFYLSLSIGVLFVVAKHALLVSTSMNTLIILTILYQSFILYPFLFASNSFK